MSHFAQKILMFRLVFISAIGLMTYGCASGGVQTTTGERVPDMMAAFESGDARLNCELSCAGAWGMSREKSKNLYEQGLWKDLAIQVSKVGHKSDQSYFYLGRAAEELGHLEAARTYYKLGLISFKCSGFINNCDGLVLPREILLGINRLPPSKADVALAARALNDSDSVSTELKTPEVKIQSSEVKLHLFEDDVSPFLKLGAISTDSWRELLGENEAQWKLDWLVKLSSELGEDSSRAFKDGVKAQGAVKSLQSIVMQLHIKEDVDDDRVRRGVAELKKTILKAGLKQSVLDESLKNLQTILPVSKIKTDKVAARKVVYRKATAAEISLLRKATTKRLKDPTSPIFGDVLVVDNSKACVNVNAKNSFGGYIGMSSFYLNKIDGEWHVIIDTKLDIMRCVDLISKIKI